MPTPRSITRARVARHAAAPGMRHSNPSAGVRRPGERGAGTPCPTRSGRGPARPLHPARNRSPPMQLARWLAPSLLGALLPAAIAGLATAVFGSGVARIAGWLTAVHPVLVFFSGYLLTETTFALAMVLALHASMEWVKTPRRSRALGAGLLWGAA